MSRKRKKKKHTKAGNNNFNKKRNTARKDMQREQVVQKETVRESACDKAAAHGADVALGLCFALLLMVGCICKLVLPDRAVSEEENRSLQKRPRFSVQNVMDGRYTEQLEKWMSDQFAGREQLAGLGMLIKLAGGTIEEQNIYLAAGGQLLERAQPPDREALDATTDSIRTFAFAYPEIPMRMILVPDAGEILHGQLPRYVEWQSQKEILETVRDGLQDRVEWVDALAVLQQHAGEKLYYLTDHHWTTRGAGYVYEAYAKKRDGEDFTMPAGQFCVATEDFNGVLSGNSGFDRKVREPIEIYVPGQETAVAVSYVTQQKRTATLYEVQKLEGKDKYAVFLGGNSPLIDIKTGAESDRVLMVVKDSFANCFVPFLVADYREILVVDPRYYAGTARELVTDYGVQEVLFLYRMNTFVRDRSIAGFLDGQ